MTKVYKANSIAHIVVVVNGKSRRVSFAAKTGGGSTFRTDDEALQKAIESHYRFGELFHLAETIEDKKPKKAVKPTDKPADKPAPTDTEQGDDGQEPAEDETTDETSSDIEGEQSQIEQDADETENEEDDTQGTEDEQPNLTKVNVTDFEDARDYLSDKFGISRSKIRSQKAVKEVAEANGIVFVGL